MRLAPARNRCPLCRKEIHDIVHIDVTSEEARAGRQGYLEAEDALAGDTSAAPVNATSDGETQVDTLPNNGIESAAASATLSAEEMREKRLRALQGSQDQLGTISGAGSSSAVSSTTPARTPDDAGLPPRCLQRLMKEVRAVQEQQANHLKEHAMELCLADQEGNDLRIWSLRLLTSGIDSSCALGKQLRASHVDCIQFEMWIPNAFPVQPPLVRVIRPTFNPGSFWVQTAGALCLEALTKSGWTPAMSLPQLGVHIKTMMSQGNGSVSSNAAMGQPGAAGRDQALVAMRRIESAHNDWNPMSGMD